MGILSIERQMGRTLAVAAFLVASPGCGGDDGGGGSGSDADSEGDSGEDGGTEGAPADTAPLARMTNEQYYNTVRDLFAPADIQPFAMPQQLEARGGFENNAVFNTATSPLVEAYQRVALALAQDQVVPQMDLLLTCDHNDVSCGAGYLTGLAERAWRRPVTDQEAATITADYEGWFNAHDFDTAMSLSLQVILQSSDFLYFPRFGVDTVEPTGDAVQLSSWEMASRLSYFLWNSMPDETLFELARTDQLGDADVVADQAWRMLSDWRAVYSVVNIHRQLFDLDEVGSNGIDLEHYAELIQDSTYFSEDSDWYYLEYLPQLRFEPEVFLAQTIFEGEGTLNAVLTSNRTWTTNEVADVGYQTAVTADQGVPWINVYARGVLSNFDSPFYENVYYPVDLDPTKRAGIFTLAGVLSAKAGPQQPSPVKRGVMILDRLLCTELTPPGDVPPLEDVNQLDYDTNREKYLLHQQSEACAGCHRSIDGIGFTFENYDSLGRWRDLDNGFPVDATGELLNTDQDGPVNNAVELMQKLGSSRTVHDCYVRQMFRTAYGRDETTEDEPTLTHLQDGFWESGGNIPALLVNIAASYEFRHRKVVQ